MTARAAIEFVEEEVIELDAQQQEAVNVGAGPARIIAAAGAGKTRCLTERIVRLIEAGVMQSSIVAATFTKAAATEMLERVAKRLGVPSDSLKVKLCTLHSLGLSIVYQNTRALGYSGQIQVSEARCAGILRQLLREPGKPYRGMEYNIARAYVAAAKRQDLSPADLRGEITDKRLAQLYADYEREKVAHNLVQFDDMVFKAWRLLRDHEEVRERYQNKFRWVMVDECHDTDLVQLRLCMALAAPQHNLWVVADLNQSIYGFRGAQPELCEKFPSLYEDCKTIYVARNYRSRPAIIEFFKEVISTGPYATKEFLDAVQPTREQGNRPAPMCKVFANDYVEAEFVASEITRIRVVEPKSTIAVLYRMNRQSRILEETLRAQKITYVVRGAASFFRLKEVESAIAFLAFIQNQGDNDAIQKIMLSSCPAAYGLGKAAVDEIIHEGHLFSALGSYLFARTQTRNAARRLHKTLMNIIHFCADQGVQRELECVYERTGLVRDDDASEMSGDNDRSENLRELLRAASQFKTRKEFLDYVKSFSAGATNDSGAVELLTIHRSKGLQYEHVFVVGVDEEIIPHKRAGDIEEERRLLYVALSRAEETLYALSNSSPSHFIGRWPKPEKALPEAEKHLIGFKDNYAEQLEARCGVYDK